MRRTEGAGADHMTEKALPQFIHHESSPLGDILLAADEVGLTVLLSAGAALLFPISDEEKEDAA